MAAPFSLADVCCYICYQLCVFTSQLVLAADVQAAPARTFEAAMAACSKAEELEAGTLTAAAISITNADTAKAFCCYCCHRFVHWQSQC
jgi:hypothetical protein